MAIKQISNNKVLKTIQLNKFKEHKYQSEGISILEPMMQVFWNKIVEYIPPYIAPNLLTIVGFIVNVLATLIIIFYSPGSKNSIPSWALLFSSLSVFFYQTMDAIDGKQARKIKLSTPLGELFDHGCDALSTMLLCIISSSAMELGLYPNILFITHLSSHIIFYSFQWKTYVLGKMSFTKISVTELQISIMFICFISALFGTHIYSLPFIGNINFVYVYFISLNISSIISLFSFIYAIKDGGPGKNGTTVASTSIVSPIIPILICSFLFILIHNHMFYMNDYQTHITVFHILIGLTFAKLNINILVSYMTKHALKLFDRILLAPMILWVVVHLQLSNIESFTLYCVTIGSLYDVLIYFVTICYEISEYLKIPIFSVPDSY